MAHIYKRGARYRIQFRDHTGKYRDVKGFSSLKATQIEAARLEDEAIKIKRGTLTPRDVAIQESSGKPLETHLEEWRSSIVAGGSSQEHADLCHFRVSQVLALCNGGKGCTRIGQIDLGEVQEAIKRLMDEGLAQQTANHVVQSCKQFSRWLWRRNRSREHVLYELRKYALTDVKIRRTDLRWADVVKMIQFVESDSSAFARRFKIPGRDRAMMYRVAAASGFRRKALRSLTPESFNTAKGEASVTVLPGYSKSKKALTVPLSDDLAAQLAAYLASKPKGVPLWDIPDCSAWMLRADFRRAGIVFPDDKLARDFHCLRHTFITSLVDAGVDLKTVQELAGHSVITLTARYTHRSADHKRRAANSLPAMPPAPKPPEQKSGPAP